MSHPDRPTGPHYDLKQPQFAVGDRVDREKIMGDGWYRSEILRDQLKDTRRVLLKLKKNGYVTWSGGRLPEGNKDAIRHVMEIIDTAYEVEVSGVVMLGMHIDNTWTNQCYVGGGSGWSGMIAHATLLFRAVVPYEAQGRTEQHAGVNITRPMWAEWDVLKARI
jgi:hypothetical protein